MALGTVEHPNEKHGFKMIGSVNELFARYYDDRTITGGEVVQIQAPPQPQWIAPLSATTRARRCLSGIS